MPLTRKLRPKLPFDQVQMHTYSSLSDLFPSFVNQTGLVRNQKNSYHKNKLINSVFSNNLKIKIEKQTPHGHNLLYCGVVACPIRQQCITKDH